jgi:DNA-directed RNA polymerase specialized sigma24 family protein
MARTATICAWWSRCAMGDAPAYEQLLGRFQQPVYALALRLLDDPSESADVVQEVFLKVFRNIGSFRGSEQPEDLDLPDHGK